MYVKSENLVSRVRTTTTLTVVVLVGLVEPVWLGSNHPWLADNSGIV